MAILGIDGELDQIRSDGLSISRCIIDLMTERPRFTQDLASGFRTQIIDLKCFFNLEQMTLCPVDSELLGLCDAQTT